ncbi:TetR/AcrR family transcriptional regulator [Breoghania sp. JC706]|uniref:TetR/AcrR family transcriptional regulator n=1 Tax=Breoghania sp. JC706 TaxID=3117732 RepID=UPI003007F61C
MARTAGTVADDSDFTPRQAAVLTCALSLLVEGGEKGLTTAGLARAANCSKESLYKWFGDRDGLLEAVVTFQASKVRPLGASESALDAAGYRRRLVTFAHELLSVLAGDVSLALNRLAIGQASRPESPLGRLLVERGKHSVTARGRALLAAGRRQRHLEFDDATAAYSTFYGLVVRDVHLRLLLGDALEPGEDDFAAQAEAAVNQFCRLYGSQRSVEALSTS